MACGCNKKANTQKINNVNSPKTTQPQKLPLVTTNSSNNAKKVALANVSKKISKRQ